MVNKTQLKKSPMGQALFQLDKEIEKKYNKAIKKYQNGETTYNKIFTHYAASAASCLNLMY